jgi:lysophospholipase L1-like esterase
MKRTLYRNRLSTLIFASLIFISTCIAQEKQAQTGSKWEGEIAAFDKLNQTEKYSDHSILFVGSSSIRLWSTLKEDMAPYPVIQRGFGGSNSPAVLQYIERIAYPHRLDAVVIFVANDITGSTGDLTPEQSSENFGKIVKLLRAKFKKQPIFVVEITPCMSRWKKWSVIQQDNALLKSLCKKGKHLYFIETAASYLNEKGEPRDELFRDDHLHLNPSGYKIWSALIKAEIEKRIKDKG